MSPAQPDVPAFTYTQCPLLSGGLTRTCEAFGASRLVISDLKATEHRNFDALAMTAQNWLPIDECSEADIPAYIHERRAEGFQIVGLEQTAKSEEIQVGDGIIRVVNRQEL